MSNIVVTLPQKPDFKCRTSASNQDILKAEQQLGLCFATEFKEYLRAFGAVSVNGREITGICHSKRLHVVDVTLEEWLHNKVPSDWYVVEQLNIDGIVIWQDSKGNVYQTAPGCANQKIASSLYDYIIS